MLKLDSAWCVTEGEEALDLSFLPEEFDVPRVGDKTLPDLVREMEGRSQISTADKEWITGRELEVAAGNAHQNYQQEQTDIVQERADTPGSAVKPHRLGSSIRRSTFFTGGVLLAASPATTSDPTTLWVVTGWTILGFGVCGGLLGALLVFLTTRSRRAWKVWFPILFVGFALLGIAAAYAFLWTA